MVDFEQMFPLEEGGQKLWNQLTAEMPEGILESIDAGMMTSLCRWWEVWRYWDKHTTDPKPARAYKATCMAGTAYKHFLNAAKEFGLTPKSRKELQYDPAAHGTDTFSLYMRDQLNSAK